MLSAVSGSLDADQDQRFVGADLGPNCLQRLSADDKDPTSMELTWHLSPRCSSGKYLHENITWFVQA